MIGNVLLDDHRDKAEDQADAANDEDRQQDDRQLLLWILEVHIAISRFVLLEFLNDEEVDEHGNEAHEDANPVRSFGETHDRADGAGEGAKDHAGGRDGGRGSSTFDEGWVVVPVIVHHLVVEVVVEVIILAVELDAGDENWDQVSGDFPVLGLVGGPAGREVFVNLIFQCVLEFGKGEDVLLVPNRILDGGDVFEDGVDAIAIITRDFQLGRSTGVAEIVDMGGLDESVDDVLQIDIIAIDDADIGPNVRGIGKGERFDFLKEFGVDGFDFADALLQCLKRGAFFGVLFVEAYFFAESKGFVGKFHFQSFSGCVLGASPFS